jgi:hypothetical protein
VMPSATRSQTSATCRARAASSAVRVLHGQRVAWRLGLRHHWPTRRGRDNVIGRGRR